MVRYWPTKTDFVS